MNNVAASQLPRSILSIGLRPRLRVEAALGFHQKTATFLELARFLITSVTSGPPIEGRDRDRDDKKVHSGWRREHPTIGGTHNEHAFLDYGRRVEGTASRRLRGQRPPFASTS